MSEYHHTQCGEYVTDEVDLARMTASLLEERLPEHKGSLTLTHNDHKSYYETVEQWEAKLKTCGGNEEDADPVDFGWVSVEQRQLAIETGSVWELRWYPRTPIGFVRLCACDLNVLLEAGRQPCRS